VESMSRNFTSVCVSVCLCRWWSRDLAYPADAGRADIVPLTSKDQSGDDGTRTHDPLLAKVTRPDVGESSRTIMAVQSHYVIVSE
jgi:hypothetical protein